MNARYLLLSRMRKVNSVEEGKGRRQRAGVSAGGNERFPTEECIRHLQLRLLFSKSIKKTLFPLGTN